MAYRSQAATRIGRASIKHVDDASAVFACIDLFADDVVGDITKRAAQELQWSVNAAHVELFLVRGGAEDPTSDEEAVALTGRRLGATVSIARTGIVDGVCLLAKTTSSTEPGLSAELQRLSVTDISTVYAAPPLVLSGLSAKMQRLSVTDVSTVYAAGLVSAAPFVIQSVTDLRRELSASLTGPIFVQRAQSTLLSEGTTALPLQETVDTAMVKIEELFVRAWLYAVQDGTEEVWASTADLLTGSVLLSLDRLTAALGMEANRNAVDPSGSTDAGLRPDYWLIVDGALLLKAEYKRTPGELAAAKEELASKMKSWNPVALRGLPFVPCYAVGGEKLQFCAVVCNPDGTCSVHDASVVYNMRLELDRVHIVRATFNLFRVLIALRRKMPVTVPTLYKEHSRPNGASITIMDDHVRKVCFPANDGVYACLMGDAPVPSAIRIKAIKSSKSALVALTIVPVCAEVLPESVEELRHAVRCVLTALTSFHSRGFVHRDVRWPNVLRDAAGNWLLSDFELASANATLLPERYLGSSSFPPEARSGEPFTFAGDVWQVGLLVRTWSARGPSFVLPLPAVTFYEQLMSADQVARPTCAQALRDLWSV